MTTNINETEKKVTFIYESKEEMKKNRLSFMESAANFPGYTVCCIVAKKKARQNSNEAMWNNMKKQIKGVELERNFSRDYYNHSEIGRRETRFYHLNEDGSKVYMK